MKKGDARASFALALRFGSIVNKPLSKRPNPDGRSCSETTFSTGTIFLTCSMLLDDNIPRILCHPCESKHSLASGLVDLSRSSFLNGPTARSLFPYRVYDAEYMRDLLLNTKKKRDSVSHTIYVFCNLHQCEMLGIVMCSKEKLSGIQLSNDTSTGPKIRWITPTPA